MSTQFVRETWEEIRTAPGNRPGLRQDAMFPRRSILWGNLWSNLRSFVLRSMAALL